MYRRRKLLTKRPVRSGGLKETHLIPNVEPAKRTIKINDIGQKSRV